MALMNRGKIRKVEVRLVQKRYAIVQSEGELLAVQSGRSLSKKLLKPEILVWGGGASRAQVAGIEQVVGSEVGVGSREW